MLQMDMVHEIRAAKRAHINWVSHAHALIEGLPLERGQVPVEPTACKFGLWYYGRGQALASLSEFKAIEAAHNALHQTYGVIFRHLFGHEQQSHPSTWFERWFGSRSEAPDDSREAARKLFPELKRHSQIVVTQLESLEHRVLSMSDEELGSFGITA